MLGVQSLSHVLNRVNMKVIAFIELLQNRCSVGVHPSEIRCIEAHVIRIEQQYFKRD